MEREPRADKVAIVDELRERFDESDAVLVTEYRGLDVGQMADLRRALREAGTTYKIYKNTLVRRAVVDSAPEGLEELLYGPTALAFVDSDASAAAKALKEFASANDALVIKGGLLSGGLLDEAQVRELAELPSREELLSQLAAGLAAPMQQIASMMNNLLSEVSGLLQALSDKGDRPESAEGGEGTAEGGEGTAEGGEGTAEGGEGTAEGGEGTAEGGEGTAEGGEETAEAALVEEAPAEEAAADDAPHTAEQDAPAETTPAEEVSAEAVEASAETTPAEEVSAEGGADADD